jgi:hypothetical protein
MMGLGILCTITVVPKFIKLKKFGDPDFTWVLWQPVFYIQVEALIGITVACIPPLKGLLEAGMKKMGLLSSDEAEAMLRQQEYYQQNWDPNGHLSQSVDDGKASIEAGLSKNREPPV